MILDCVIVISLRNAFASYFSWNIVLEVELPPPSRFLMAQESNFFSFGFHNICFIPMIHIPEHHGSTRSHPFTRKSDTNSKPNESTFFLSSKISSTKLHSNVTVVGVQKESSTLTSNKPTGKAYQRNQHIFCGVWNHRSVQRYRDKS